MMRSMRGTMSLPTPATIAAQKKREEEAAAEKEKKRVASLTPQQKEAEAQAAIKKKMADEQKERDRVQAEAQKARAAEIAAYAAADAERARLAAIKKKKDDIEWFEKTFVQVVDGRTYHQMYREPYAYSSKWGALYNKDPQWYWVTGDGRKIIVDKVPEPYRSRFDDGYDYDDGFDGFGHQYKLPQQVQAPTVQPVYDEWMDHGVQYRLSEQAQEEASPRPVKFARTKAYLKNLGSALKGVGQALLPLPTASTE